MIDPLHTHLISTILGLITGVVLAFFAIRFRPIPTILGLITGVVLAFFAIRFAEAQQPPAPQEYCNAIAEFSEAVAKDRDNGTPEWKAIDIASQHTSPNVRRDLIFVVQFVHAEPHNAPSEEASYAFAICWAAYGE